MKRTGIPPLSVMPQEEKTRGSQSLFPKPPASLLYILIALR
jgi:hypothetical protein